MKCFILQMAIIGLTLPSLETLELHESGKSREPIYPGQCTHPFVPIEGERCYFLSYGVIEHSWNDAKTICQWLHPEGILAEFHSMDELVDVTLFLGRDDAACTAWGELQWQDMPNENILPFICESPPNPRPVTLGCPPGFFLLGSSCYALVDDQKLSWDDAQILWKLGRRRETC
ncbi:unnamed protein product [Cyprideis torosa]|uniref:Uncharacterized protein n=1 Tax=Cyprideis torosa TaxID=163714 RepID=A0A7R8WGD5_9CRUS|nr:unnamed protein product [Cyprideis torosa]CAG0895196.1 unnamed protein product [Cyprideis torosa]